MSRLPTIGFVGLSHLGIVSGIAVASKGFLLVGYDPDVERCAALSRGELPLFEPGLDELVSESSGRCRFSADPAALGSCDVIYISRDVPTNAQNISELAPVRELFATVAQNAKQGTTIVVLSQVSPGFTRALLPALESRPDLHLYYQVETLIFGAAVERALNPERYIIGAKLPSAALPQPYLALLDAFDCPRFIMRYESAELAKISINMFLVSSLVTTSTIAEICERVGAEWDEIAPALRLDRRIGPHAYLKPGLGVAGGNLERDLVTLKTIAAQHGTEAGLIDAWTRNLDYRKEWVLRTLHQQVLSKNPQAKIAIWGLAYKQDTNSIKNAPSLKLLEALKCFNVAIYDPQAKLADWDKAKELPSIRQECDRWNVITDADALVVMTPWSEFSTKDLEQIARKMPGRALIDPHGIFNRVDAGRFGFTHYTLGVGSEDSRTDSGTQMPIKATANSRIVLLGGNGFVGRSISSLFSQSGQEPLSLSSKDLDLTAPDCHDKLSSLLKPSDHLVFISALTPDRGRGPDTMEKNINMAVRLAEVLAKTPVAHLTYISSDAVYGDEQSLVNEQTPSNPGSYHGIMHLARERIMIECARAAKIPLLIVRPCAIYGAGDPHQSYGPNRFMSTAQSAKPITLFGDGEEQRDHIYIGDVAYLTCALIGSSETGIFNLASGRSISFADVAHIVAKAHMGAGGAKVNIERVPKSGPTTPPIHRHFDITALIHRFPQWSAMRLERGITL